MPVVQAVTGAVVDPQLADAIPDASPIAQQAYTQPVDAGNDPGARSAVT